VLLKENQAQGEETKKEK